MSKKITNTNYEQLKLQIVELLQKGREQAGRAVNTILLQTYWQIGRHIIEFEQQGKVKAEYSAKLLNKLSKDLTLTYGKGLSRSTRLFYTKFQKIQTPSEQLSWSHYVEIIKRKKQ